MNKFINKYTVILIFMVIGFSIYSTSMNAAFHFDDVPNILDNSSLKIKDISFNSLKSVATSNNGQRPVSYLSFALNYYYNGMETKFYHVVNVSIHIINAFLIYLIILQMFNYGSEDDDEKKEILSLSAFFTALFWLVTPLNSHTVIYIVQRMTLLMTLFFLLAFLMYLLGRKSAKTRYFILSVIFFTFSVMSKENGAVLPLVIIIYEFIFVKKGELKNLTKGDKIFLAALLLVLLAPMVILRAEIYKQFLEGGKDYGFTMYERTLTQFRVLVFCLSLIALPLPSRLSISHDIVKSTSLFAPITTFFSMIFIIAIFVFAIVRMKKSPYLSFAILFFFIIISVETIMPIELFFEHRAYLSSVFLIGFAVDYTVRQLYFKRKLFIITILIILVLGLSLITAIRGIVWISEVSIWGDAVEKYPNDARSHYNLGTGYLNADKLESAVPHLIFAITEWEKAEKNNSIKLTDLLYGAYNNLATVQGKLGDYFSAEQNFLKAIEHKSSCAEPYNNLGLLYGIKKDYTNAIRMYELAIKYNLRYGDTYYNLGLTYIEINDMNKAEQNFLKVLNMNPRDADAFNELGLIYQYRGDYKKALSYFDSALKIDPKNAMVQKNIANTNNLINNKSLK